MKPSYKFMEKILLTQAGEGRVVGNTPDGNLVVTLKKPDKPAGVTRIFTWCEKHQDWFLQGKCNICLNEEINETGTETNTA